MAKILIMTDSACDITKEQEESLNIKVMNFKIAVGEDSYVSREDFDNEKFFEILNAYDGIPATSQITVFEYEDEFERIYNEGYSDIINVTINANGSATYNNAVMAANNFFEAHPEAVNKFHIYNLDSASYTCAYGYPVVVAAQKVQKGESAKEIVSFIKEWLSKVQIYFAMYTLRYAKKSGRIPSAAAFVGEVLGLKPVMKICEGEITTAEKVRGDKAVVPKVVDMTTAEMIPQTPYLIIYGDDIAPADEVAAIMTKKLGYPPVEKVQIGAAIAINAGPKVVGVAFKSKNR